jgi:hypothetical protein
LSVAKNLFVRAPLSAAEQFIAPAAYLLLTPFMLNLGDKIYSSWVMLIAFSGLSAYITLGYTGIQVRELAGINGDTRDSVTKNEATAYRIVLLGMLCGLTGATLGSYNTLLQWCSWGLVIACVTELDKLIVAPYRARAQFLTVFLLEASGRTLWCGLTVLLAKNYPHDIHLVVGAAFLGRTLTKIILVWVIDRRGLYWISLLRRPFQIAALFQRSGWMLAQLTGASLISVADRFVLSTVAGPSFFAKYFPIFQLSSLALTAVAAGSSVILSLPQTDMARDRAWVLGAICVVSLLPGAIIGAFSETIFSLWLSSASYVFDTRSFNLVNASFSWLAFLAPLHFFLLRIGKDRALSITENVAGIVYLSAVTVSAFSNPNAVYFVRFVQPMLQTLCYAYIIQMVWKESRRIR